MNNLIKVNTDENGDVIISGRELHEFLEIGTDYKKWFDRMKEYGFSENIDFATVSQKSPITNGGYQEKFDHAIKYDLLKNNRIVPLIEKESA